MSYRMKITLPDPTMTQLEVLAERRGEPASRVAAQMVSAGIADGKDLQRAQASISASPPTEAPDSDRHAPWIEPVLGDPEWRSVMWGRADQSSLGRSSTPPAGASVSLRPQ